jgi:hypothetical protein
MALGNTNVARLQAVLDADTSSFDRKMRASQTKTEKFGVAAKTALIGGVAAGVTAVGVAAKIGWDEYNQGAKVAAQTNAVIKSTGGVANVSAKHLEDLGESLMRISGVDDELIKSGENVLLTFTHVRNEAGKGNAIFDRTTKLALDLSTALGTDLQSANIQLGKALNGSATGVSALQRSGVSFTDQQKEQIKTLFENGNALKAQKIILKEVATEFGGSAKAAGETFGGQINIARERLNNFLGDLVSKAIPYIQRFVKWIGPIAHRVLEAARKAVDDLTKVFHEHRKEVGYVVTGLTILVKGLQLVIRWNILLWGTIFKIWMKILDVTLSVIGKIVDAVKKMIGFFKDVWRITGNAADKVKEFFQAVWDGVQKVLGPLGKVADIFGGIKGAVSGAAGAIGGVFGDGIIGAGGAGVASVSPTLFDDLALGSGFGLSLSSGYRPGAVTSTGNPSLHGVFPSKAIDMAGSAAGMRAFFWREVVRAPFTGIRELIHNPYAWYPGAGLVNIAGTGLGNDHIDHVHVGSYDRGGFLRPGWNLAYNGLGRNEPVGAGMTVVINANVVDQRAGEWIVRQLEDWQRRGGR